MADRPTADAILSAAQGAHATSREILELMLEPADDPIAAILAALQAIQLEQRSLLITQQQIVTRLDTIERRLASKT